MARIEASTHIEASPARVWAVLTDWEGQARWMQDARSVEVLSAHRAGTDVLLRCRTDLAGFVVTDDMTTTSWVPQRSVGVRHVRWPIRGIGAFELEPTGEGTFFTWWEEVEAPFGSLGDALTDVVIVPFVRRVFRGSLANLKRVAEEAPAAPAPG